MGASERVCRLLTAAGVAVFRLKLLLALLAVLGVLSLSPEGGVPVAEAHSMYTVSLVVQHSGKCMDVQGGHTEDGTPIQQYTCNGTEAQQIDITDVRNQPGWHQFKFRNSGKCLDVQWASHDPGAPLWLWPCNGSDAQKFTAPSGYNSTSQIKNKGSQLCVEVPGASTANGVDLKQAYCGTGSHRKWKVPACLDQKVTYTDDSCRAYQFYDPQQFDIHFDCYSRVVYCNNVDDYVTINWVELTMDVDSGSEPLECQGSYMYHDPVGELDFKYRVNRGTPFPVDAGDGWRGSVLFWNDTFTGVPLTFPKFNGLNALSITTLAGPDRPWILHYGTTCGGDRSRYQPVCYETALGGWYFQAPRNQTIWPIAEMHPDGFCC